MNRDLGLGPGAWGFAAEGASPRPQPQGPRPFLSLRNIEKSFPEGNGRQFVLRRISLDVAAGDFVTIMGPLGAGESTVLVVVGMVASGLTGEFCLQPHQRPTITPK